MARPTVAEINLSNLQHNLETMRGYLKSSTEILAVVKANAYGHGAVKVTSRLVDAGVSCFGVATVEEGIELRDGGVAEEITVLGGVLGDQLEESLSLGLDTVVSSMDHLKEIVREAEKIKKVVKIHLKIDTGMGRLGIFPAELKGALMIAVESPFVSLRGVMTHLSSADGTEEEDREYTKEQLQLFDSLMRDHELKNLTIHALNSSGIVRFPECQFSMVRPGITLYGSRPRLEFEDLGLLPVMNLVTQIYYVKEYPPGSHISYGRLHTTAGKERIGVLPIGYADGMKKVLSPGLELFVEGKPCKVIGAICMDNTMVDLSHIPEAAVGSDVLIFGEKWGVKAPVEVVAEKAGTIPYEVLTSITNRVPRIFIDS